MGVSGVETDEGLGRLFAEEGPKLWRAMLAFTQDPTLASDAVAESFAQCLRRGDAIRAAVNPAEPPPITATVLPFLTSSRKFCRRDGGSYNPKMKPGDCLLSIQFRFRHSCTIEQSSYDSDCHF